MEKLIDCHCHLDLYPDPHAVAREAVVRGVYVISVTTTPTAFEKTSELAPEHSRIRTALGLHPEIAVSRRHELKLFERLLPKTRYVGEVGLDGSRAHRGTLDEQSAILMQILIMCGSAGGKIITLHSRSARSRVLDLIAQEPRAGRPILHWFTGSANEVRRAVELGCWFSVGPAMLESSSGKAAVLAMPKERIVPETDGPFGTAKGTVAYPWDTGLVDRALAELWNEPVSLVGTRLEENFRGVVAPVHCD